MSDGQRDLGDDMTAEMHERAPSGVPVTTVDLTPAYANAVQVQFSPYEFMLTFLRTEYMLQGPADPNDKVQAPLLIAARVALSHGAMREFLDAAIDNYEKWRRLSNGPALKCMMEEDDESSE